MRISHQSVYLMGTQHVIEWGPGNDSTCVSDGTACHWVHVQRAGEGAWESALIQSYAQH